MGNAEQLPKQCQHGRIGRNAVINAGNRTDCTVINGIRIVLWSHVIADQILFYGICKFRLVGTGERVIFCKVLLPVGQPVHQVDGNDLIHPLILSHAEEFIFHQNERQC